MSSFCNTFMFAGLALATCALPASAAVTQLVGPGDFAPGSTVISFDEKPNRVVINSAYSSNGLLFSRDDQQAIPSLDWVGLGRTTTSSRNVIATISGVFVGGVASGFVNHLNLLFDQPTFEVGAYFGNDQGAMSVTLSLFDASDTFLGSHLFVSNANTNVDQFLGLRSTLPFVRARYENNVTFLSVVLDDVRFGNTAINVPTPGLLPLFSLSLVFPILYRTARRSS